MGVCILSRFSRIQLCDPMDGSPWLFCPWNSPGKNTGVGYHAFLQRNLPNPGIEPGSPTLQADSLVFEPPEKASSVFSFGPFGVYTYILL